MSFLGWLTLFGFIFISVLKTVPLVTLVQLPLWIVWDLASNFRNWSKCIVSVFKILCICYSRSILLPVWESEILHKCRRCTTHVGYLPSMMMSWACITRGNLVEGVGQGLFSRWWYVSIITPEGKVDIQL